MEFERWVAGGQWQQLLSTDEYLLLLIDSFSTVLYNVCNSEAEKLKFAAWGIQNRLNHMIITQSEIVA